MKRHPSLANLEAIDSKISLAIMIICLHYVLYCTLCGICLPELLSKFGTQMATPDLSVILVMIDSTQYTINFVIYTAACRQYRQVQ